MKKSLFISAAIFSVILCFSGFGYADIVEFEFQGPLTWGSSLDFSADGVNIMASGVSGSHSSYVNQNFAGLGVSAWIFDNPQIDGIGADDLLLLTFTQDVMLLEASFTRVDECDQFRLLVDGEHVLDASMYGGFYDFTDALNSDDRTGALFGFTVTNWTDNYRLLSLKVDTAAVPIASTIWLLGSGLVGLVILRRRSIS